ncbi:hypothetical protein, partial [Nodularia sp. UHCC 0506]|uniref:hypothetical protein n=1 Tax=Nodularia sp. UHCC 0506 TaxID=3110243 RepID=UPI002B205527
EARWSEIEALLRYEFKDSDFNDGFTVERPLWHINEGIKGNLGPGIKHVVAIDPENEIVAAAFCLATCRNNGQSSCDLGWFFASSKLSKIQKIKALDKVFHVAYEIAKNTGFEYLVTNMGTAVGAKYAERRWGCVNQPEGEITNRWVKKLT